MAGVVRRDGLREAVTALRDKMLLCSDPYSRDYATRLSHALDAEPDADIQTRVEALADRWTCDCGTPQRHRASCRSWHGAALREVLLAAVPDVPPDPPATTRDQVVDVLYGVLAEVIEKVDWDAETEAERAADALIASGVLVDSGQPEPPLEAVIAKVRAALSGGDRA